MTSEMRWCLDRQNRNLHRNATKQLMDKWKYLVTMPENTLQLLLFTSHITIVQHVLHLIHPFCINIILVCVNRPNYSHILYDVSTTCQTMPLVYSDANNFSHREHLPCITQCITLELHVWTCSIVYTSHPLNIIDSSNSLVCPNVKLVSDFWTMSYQC